MMTTLLGIVALAGLFAVVGLLPFPDRGCGSCSGDCASCPLDEEGP
jgi:hypothetical protein